ncbi:hypothetical protein ACFOEK_19555 [Litoribrevibacter euphylliae]|uniref:Uncharacterized protein n=1 Tax=Litoribrevibacter euphylliae TaxID=1834034 RepID=A0ABV7HM79_9GAMM
MDKTRVLALIRDGRTIAAIKYVREATGKDLKESKLYVESLRGSEFNRPRLSLEFQEAAEELYRLIPSAKECGSLFRVERILECAEAENKNIEFVSFAKWDQNYEFNAYDDDELLHEILGKNVSGRLLVICDDFEHPYTIELSNLSSEVGKFSRCLANTDFILIELDRDIVTIVGHWGLCARIANKST